MSYRGYFNSIYDKKRYTVQIQTQGTTTDILLGESPFIVSYEGDTTIYKPLKLSSATITVVHNDYLFDIYNATAQGTKVSLLNELGAIE